MSAPLDRWSACAAVAALAIAVAVLPRAVHSDDLEVIRAVSGDSYAELWTAPFRGVYYRPLTSTIVKLGVDAGDANRVLRITGALLIAASLWVFLLVARRLAGPARLTGALCLLAAPFTFVAVAPFGVGAGDSIVGLALLIAVRESQAHPQRPPWILLLAAVVALAAKESGLVVAAYATAECLRRRRFAFAALAAAIAAGYLIAHVQMIESRPYILRTGYLFDMLSVSEQRQRFGDAPLPLRMWTAAANLMSALCYLPVQGQLRWSPAIGALAVVTTGSAALCARYLWRHSARGQWWPLLCTLPANAAIGFAYARPRVMFAAYVAIAVLLACAVDERWRAGGRRLVTIALLAWIAVFASTLARLLQMP